MDKTVRNWRFDYLKGVSCIIVVLFHVPIPGLIGEAIIYGMRFPVPVFFMITGYYCETRSNAWILNKTKQLLIRLFMVELLYGIWNLFLWIVIEGGTVSGFIRSIALVQRPVKTLLCGSVFNGTLWFLYAAIWTYILILLCRKAGLMNKLFFCIIYILLMIAFMVVGRMRLQNNMDPEKFKDFTFLFCNAVSFGLPMTASGMMFARYKDKIREWITFRKNILLFGVGSVVLVTEFLIYGKYMDFHFSTFIISVALFLFTFTYKKDIMPFKRLFSYIGQNMSIWIYFDHLFVNSLVLLIAKKVINTGSYAYQYAHPFVVIVISCIMAWVIYKIKNMAKRKKVNETKGECDNTGL